MASGYDGSDRVWVTDRAAGRAYPIHRALISLDPQRYEVDEDHPVLDAAGVLLEGKPVTPQGRAAGEDEGRDCPESPGGLTWY